MHSVGVWGGLKTLNFLHFNKDIYFRVYFSCFNLQNPSQTDLSHPTHSITQNKEKVKTVKVKANRPRLLENLHEPPDYIHTLKFLGQTVQPGELKNKHTKRCTMCIISLCGG